jgi:Kef-type K+ transport system membrane component KefB
MTPFLQLTFALAVLLLAAKIGGYVSTRLGQPSVLGELIVGLLLGPSLLNFLHLPWLSEPTLAETVHKIGELGVLFLMFLAGLELHLNELTRNTRISALAGTLGVLFPVGLGWGTGALFGMETRASLFLGLTLAATSVSISAQTLMELKQLRSRVGLGLLGAAVFDDILVILLLSTFLAVVDGGGSLSGLLLILGRMVGFLVLSLAFGLWVLPYLARQTARLPISQSVLSLAIVMLLLYSVAAEAIGGMAAITGAFIAGLMFARSHERERLEGGMNALAYGLFVPVFFISIGLNVNVRSLESDALWLTIAMILVAIVSKLVGAALGARWGGFSWREAWQLGAGMISRGEVGLIVIAVGLQQGLANTAEFSATVAMVIATTLITPPLLRLLFQQPEPASGKGLKKEKVEENVGCS